VDLIERLRAAGCVFAEDEAAVLTAEATDEAHLEQMVQRRVDGEPLEQVVGWAELDGLRLVVAPGVFVPRRRTVLLVRETVALTPANGTVLDLCCGVGAVAAVVGRDRPGATLHLADIDPFAVDCARRNVPRARAHTGDLFDPLPHDLRFDVVAANAPYVPTDEIAHMPPEARDHELRAALDGGLDGVAVHRRIAAEVARWLSPGGSVLIETAAHLAPLTAAALETAGLVTRTASDEAVGGTVVVGRSGGGTAPIA
jgi:release factor glutamine methyltransferase